MKIFVLLLTLLCAALPAHGSEAAIPLGERLVYRMSWLGIPIGTAELWAKEQITMNGKEVIHVIGRMETNKFLSVIYPIRNEIHSWIDADTLTSVKFEKHISEGMMKAHEIMEFKTPAHDVISAFYWARRQPLTPGQSVRTALIVDGNEWTLEVVVLQRRTLELRGWGQADTLLIEPRGRTAGLPEKKGKSLMDILDDASKIPLRITY